MLHPLRTAMAVIVFAATAMVVQAAEPTPKPPTGFTDERLSKIQHPTSIAFLHDGRALVTDQSGKLYLWQEGNSATLPPVYDMGSLLCTSSDAGLLGIVVDPKVNADGSEYFYMYFTMRGQGSDYKQQCPRSGNDNPATEPFNRLSRFTFKDGSIVGGSEFIVLDHIPTRIQDHLGGGMFIAQDGYLYVSTGDGDFPQKSNDPDSLRGKILRINPATGDGVTGNPYFTDPAAVQCGNPSNPQFEQGKPCREVFAVGLRHPWRIALKPGTDPNNVEFYINDVGKATWEEINVGKVGADYGWDKREGPCLQEKICTPGLLTPPNDPIFWYLHTNDSREAFKGCSAVTGAAFVPPGVWPEEYDNVYLFGDYTCGRIWRLDPDGAGGYKASTVVDEIISPSTTSKAGVTTMTFGPAPDPTHPGKMTQALYYGTYSGGGQVRRVIFTGSRNHVPVADMSADKTFGNSPLTVTFSGAGSSDPDGDKLTYDWDFGDGQTSKNATAPTIAHTYQLPAGHKTAVFTATLVVRDTSGAASDPASIRIDLGNNPPVPAIASPAADYKFKVGETVTLSGSATDPDETGPLPDSALTWHVLRHHDTHTHEELFPTQGNNIVIPMTEPEGLSAAHSSYLEIQLTATDSQGRTSTITQTLMPHLVDLTFQTEPAGLQLVADDTTITGQGTVTSWENYSFGVSAPTQQDASGQWMVFDHWSDGAPAHDAAMRRIPAWYWPRHEDHPDATEPTREIVTPAAPATYVAVFKPLAVQANAPEVHASINAGVADIPVQLTAASTEPVTVTYTTHDGTAKAGVDYTAASGTLTFAPGQTSIVVSVPLIRNDNALDKTFTLVLSNPQQAALGTPSTVTVTITDVASGPALRIYLPFMRQ
ncbi:MAG TPA: PQQ-dependent sugar dehydrogenase [Roseiflexaceae bacterium]|nr:PQQ-dependent sugar dehydrogenase [Roseiflexaceae bacterium]